MTATRTEDRLVAALQARAEQVRPEDLAPFVTPEPARSRPRWGAYALAAAAIAAVVAAPFAVGALRHTSAPEPGPAAPSGSPVPSASADPTPTPAGGTRTVRGTADVDGDGQPDAVTMTNRTGHEVRMLGLHVSVTLATGEQSTATADVSWELSLEPARDIDGDGRDVLVVRAEGGDSDVPQVFAYRQGRLQHLATAYGAPPLTNGGDADGRVLRWWFDAEGRMFSARSTRPLGQRTSTRVEVYRWTVRPAPGGGPLLGATRLAGAQCFDLVNDETPHPC